MTARTSPRALAALVLALVLSAGTDGVWARELEPVPKPGLRELEAPVRFALRESRAGLDAALADPRTTPASLARAFGQAGLLYHAHLVMGPARACYRNALRLDPQDARWPYYLGYLHQQQGRLEQAAARYAQALERDPGLGAARLRLGLARLELGELEAARPLLQAAARDPALAAAALFGLGRLAYAQRRYEEAASLLGRALRLSPGASRIHHTLGLAYRALGRREDAREHLALAGDAEPQAEDPLVDLLLGLTTGQRMLFHNALNAIQHAEYDRAVDLFRKGLSLAPENMHARVSLARALYLNGDAQASRRALESVLAQAPDHAMANFLLGLLQADEGDQRGARASLRRTIAAEPEHAGAHFHLANALLRAGRFAEAARHYGVSLERSPQNAAARRRQVRALLRAGAPHHEVLLRLEQARARGLHDPELDALLAALLAASPEPGIRDGQRALALATALYGAEPAPQHLALMAMARADLGHWQEAAALQEQALGLAMAFGQVSLIGRLEEDLSDFRGEKLSRRPWPPGAIPGQGPPTDPTRAFRDYPTARPY